MLHLLNHTRQTYGRPTFRLNVTVSHRAWLHSKAMANQNNLFHTGNLYDAVRQHPQQSLSADRDRRREGAWRGLGDDDLLRRVTAASGNERAELAQSDREL